MVFSVAAPAFLGFDRKTKDRYFYHYCPKKKLSVEQNRK